VIGDRLAGARQEAPITGRHGGEERVVDRRTRLSSPGREDAEIRAEKADAALRTALTEQHGLPDLTADESHPHPLEPVPDPTPAIPSCRRTSLRPGRVRLGRSTVIEELPDDADGSHAIRDGMVDAENETERARARPGDQQQLPQRTIARQRHGHELSAYLLEPRQAVHTVEDPHVVVEIRRGVAPAMSAAVPDRHTSQLRQRTDSLADHRAEQLGIDLTVAEESALRREEQTGDEEHIRLTGMVEDEVGFVDGGEPLLSRRLHVTPPVPAR
jgi:hypothetical protein